VTRALVVIKTEVHVRITALLFSRRGWHR
jgi:hypothetical protein